MIPTTRISTPTTMRRSDTLGFSSPMPGQSSGRPIPIAQTVPPWLAAGMRKEHRTCLPMQRLKTHWVAIENRLVWRGVMVEARVRSDDQHV